ncbi:MAG TPA: DinB family protein [Blastocatellia bacterium]
MKDSVLREELVSLLKGGQAHVDLDKAIAGLKPENRTKAAVEGERSVWEVLEHIRLAHHDILRYTLDAGWASPEWPSGYWPAVPARLTDEAWEATIRQIHGELNEMIEVVRDPKIDLTAQIPHAREHTYLREVLLAADHIGYHLGQVVALRKALGDWQA